jgi:signal transduction histidine kinase
VVASNNSGVWNQAGTAVTFSIAPAFYQRLWFRASCAVAFLGMLWAVHRLRVRHLVRQFNLGVEARVAERTRIARDLHDTLLQSFQGLLLMFEAAFRFLPDRPEQARHTLQRALKEAAEATTEARDAVQDLRSSILDTPELVQRGHFGVPGMHERAEVVGGALAVWTKPGVGTEVDLRIPPPLPTRIRLVLLADFSEA